MKKAFVLGALGLAMVIFGMVRADAAAPVPARVGYIDLQRTLNETKVGKQALSKLEAEKAKKQKELDAKQAALKKDYDELQKQSVVLKPDVVAQRQRDIQERLATLQETFMQFQQDLAKRQAELTQGIFKKAAKIIESIAKRDGYTMMLEKSESAVLYADPSLDITAEVNRRLDAGEGAK